MNLRTSWKWMPVLLLLLAGCMQQSLRHGAPPPYTVFSSDGRLLGTLDDILPELARKRVIYVGETHSRYGDHLLELEVIRRLRRRGADLAIGMEFFQKPFQKWLDAYIEGRVSETEMLEKTQWFERWRFDYRLYRPILRFARRHRIPVVALNLPRELTDEVSRKGIEGLAPADRARLPRRIDRSDRAYRKRLHRAFDRHPGKDEKRFERFLDVQYSWDEGMAQSVSDYLRAHPRKQMVVLAGSGHIAWGSGIPKRVARRLHAEQAIVLPADREAKPGEADYLVVTEEKRLSPRPLMGVLVDTTGGAIRITGITPGSGAEKAGLRKGDRILAIDGRPVSSYTGLRMALIDKRPGDRVQVRFSRGGETLEKSLVLGASPH